MDLWKLAGTFTSLGPEPNPPVLVVNDRFYMFGRNLAETGFVLQRAGDTTVGILDPEDWVDVAERLWPAGETHFVDMMSEGGNTLHVYGSGDSTDPPVNPTEGFGWSVTLDDAGEFVSDTTFTYLYRSGVVDPRPPGSINGGAEVNFVLNTDRVYSQGRPLPHVGVQVEPEPESGFGFLLGVTSGPTVITTIEQSDESLDVRMSRPVYGGLFWTEKPVGG